MSPGWNQLKHIDELFALCCSGNTNANWNRLARLPHSVCVEYTLALSVQPCSATTSGAPAGSPAGTKANILRLPGLLPKLVIWVSVTACGESLTAPSSPGLAIHAETAATS